MRYNFAALAKDSEIPSLPDTLQVLLTRLA